MTEYEEFRVCPHCGFRDVPTLIVKRATSAAARDRLALSRLSR